MNTRIETIWRDLSPFAVGFDRTFDTLSILANSKAQNTNYPPYNIRKLPDDKYSIELAVAGFDEKDIDIEVSEQNLTIDGKKSDEMNEKGIAQVSKKLSDGIQFNRKFRKDEGGKINILNKKYINEFVMCNSCKSYSTKLLKMGNIVRLKCNTCNKEYTVRDI